MSNSRRSGIVRFLPDSSSPFDHTSSYRVPCGSWQTRLVFGRVPRTAQDCALQRQLILERYWLITFFLVAFATTAAASNVPGEVGEAMRFPIEVKGGQALRERLRLDLAAVRQALQETALPEDERKKVFQQADELARQVGALPADLPPGFRAIFPLNDIHASIYALNARIKRIASNPPCMSIPNQNGLHYRASVRPD